MSELHKKYGDVVRIAPDELTFTDGLRAWKDMMGHRGPGEPEMVKAPKFYKTVKTAPVTIITADREEHSVLRKQLAPGFSDRSLRDQQPIVMQYIDLLVKRLYENSKGGTKAVDMVKCRFHTAVETTEAARCIVRLADSWFLRLQLHDVRCHRGPGFRRALRVS